MDAYVESFNTKKVRLKRFALYIGNASGNPFQYQKGAIKTGKELRETVQAMHFQYQKGAIKTIRAFSLGRQTDSFQYQKGAIKTGRQRCAGAGYRAFNTKKVRLKRPGPVGL